MTVRWTFRDTVTSETWTMPINPDAMTSPQPSKQLKHAIGVRYGLNRVRTFMSAPQPVQWSWEGVIRSQEHHDALLAWAGRTHPVEVTDHLGRTWKVLFQKFEPTDRQPTATTPVRERYRMTVLNLGRVA